MAFFDFSSWHWPWADISADTVAPAIIDPAVPVPRPIGEVDDLITYLNSRGGGYHTYGLSTTEDIITAFALCSPLQAIVSQKVFAFTKGLVTVWNPATEKPTRGQYKEWDALFRRPNRFQSQRQFFGMAYGLMQRHGYCVIMPTYPAGFSDRPAELRVIPNNLLNFRTDPRTFTLPGMKPKAGTISEGGQLRELTSDELQRMIIIRDPAAADYDENTGLPYSRIYASQKEVSNIIAALIARGGLITDRGAMGIIANGAKDMVGHIAMDAQEKARLLRAYSTNYGLMNNQSKIQLTEAPLTFTRTSFNSDELGLQPEHIACIKSICNTYGFPFTALAEGFEGKYNNSTNARRDFQDTTIDPESMDFFEQLSAGLGLYEQKLEAYMDYSGVASLQQSQQERGTGLQAMNQGLLIAWDNGFITRRQWLTELGMEVPKDWIGDQSVFDKYKWELTPDELGILNLEPDNNQNSDGSGSNNDSSAGNE